MSVTNERYPLERFRHVHECYVCGRLFEVDQESLQSVCCDCHRAAADEMERVMRGTVAELAALWSERKLGGVS